MGGKQTAASLLPRRALRVPIMPVVTSKNMKGARRHLPKSIVPRKSRKIRPRATNDEMISEADVKQTST
jgi:hypothetical protein